MPVERALGLFALLIGIDKYHDPMISNLRVRAAVQDVRQLEKYLCEKFGVQKTHLTRLVDEQATRLNIIQSFLDLRDNTEIENGDPILVLFAGHEGLVTPPPGWFSERLDGKIQSILPQDSCPTGIHAVDCIPDRTIGALLDEISTAHGNNITVILDCCPSGSGACDVTYSSRDLGGYSLPPNVDQELWCRQEIFRTVLNGMGQESHMLWTTCSENEGAKENGSRGEFTTAPLKLSRRVFSDELSYAELLSALYPVLWQNPQPQGVHQNRILSNSKAHHIHRTCYPIHQDTTSGRYILEAGDYLGVEEPGQLVPPLGGSIRIKASNNERLKIHVDYIHDATLLEILPHFRHSQAMMGYARNTRKLALVSDRLTADLEVVRDGDKLAFNILDKVVTSANLLQLSGRINLATADKILPFLNTAARYYHFLKQPMSSGIPLNVVIEFKRLQLPKKTRDRFHGRSRIPVGDNLIRDGRIELTIQSDLKDERDRDTYGFEVANNSELDLYLNVFYFDNSDLSILSYFQPGGATTNAKRDFSVRRGGTVTLGYGPGQRGLTYSVPGGQDVDVGFVKFFFSTSALDLSRIPQHSPFGSRSAEFTPDDPVECWDTVVIPIIQQRAKGT